MLVLDREISEPVISLESASFSTQQTQKSYWDTAPEWGGSWREFFKTFEGQAQGLSRTEIYRMTGITFLTLDETIREALADEILVKREIGNSEEVIVGDRKALKAEYQERYFLNDNSLKLKEMLREDPSKMKQALSSFQQTEFKAIANEFGLELVGSYFERFISFLKSSRAEEVFTSTGFYKNSQLYPDPEMSFLAPIREYIDRIVELAVSSRILEPHRQEDGRQVYKLAGDLS